MEETEREKLCFCREVVVAIRGEKCGSLLSKCFGMYYEFKIYLFLLQLAINFYL